ncbi:glycoside hydrolase family 3 C-terminal domain-containing protein [Carnimonas nigrificans]|uniref:glycoside hydrolase family 3 C-terminal domain-containing protein n=1 Tax=Carnimonas nigrificans TaxID=64323 RepID=UPI00046FFC52|nr:glycoside hydrolase family 3 C-terminal domain-containing protein [Carnimonas nigrificans]
MSSHDIKQLVEQLTLEEKASLCSGADFWHTKAVERLGIEEWMMADGPHGLRQQPRGGDHLGITGSNPATCFPSASALASSWDRSLAAQLGEALGVEARKAELSVVLGPGINIKRSPLCGRNFEYFSEDPLLAGELATSYVNALQAQSVGTSLKHFAANNQEHRRMSVNVSVDPRTLRELYLSAFERVVKKAQPWTVMCSYNRLYGEYCSQHPWLLTEVLRNEWGFSGVVVSDWGAVDDRVAGVAAGLELEMPGGNDRDGLIVKAVREGELDEAVLNTAVERLLGLYFKTRQATEKLDFSPDQHHQVARRIAADSMVLLKNHQEVLPLEEGSEVAVIGEFAKRPRYQGGGSSHVNAYRVESLLEALDAEGASYRYAQGFDIDSDSVNEQLFQQALELAKSAEKVVLYLGLPDRYESEGYDRDHLNLPDNQIALLKALSEVNQQIIVVLANGAPVVMPWIQQAAAVLESHLGGQAVGAAVADVLFGKRNPSGKLSESYPATLEQTPCFDHFATPARPNNSDHVAYAEGLMVGYRYYDTHQLEPLFPFGFGLSYTRFDYANLSLSASRIGPQDTLTVAFDVTNSGKRAGSEVVQLYLADQSGEISVPVHQLRGFDKVALEAGETQRVELTLEKRDFAYFDVDHNEWRMPKGTFEVQIAASSRDIRLTGTVESLGDEVLPTIGRNALVGDLMANEVTAQALRQAMAATFEQNPKLKRMFGESSDDEMMQAMGRYLPLRALVSFSEGAFGESDLEVLLKHLTQAVSNHHKG